MTSVSSTLHGDVLSLTRRVENIWIPFGGSFNINLARALNAVGPVVKDKNVFILDLVDFRAIRSYPRVLNPELSSAARPLCLASLKTLRRSAIQDLSNVRWVRPPDGSRLHLPSAESLSSLPNTLVELTEASERNDPAAGFILSHLLTTSLCDSAPSEEAVARVLPRLWRSYLGTLDFVRQALGSRPGSGIMLLENDRHADEAPIRVACEEYGIQCVSLMTEDSFETPTASFALFSNYSADEIRQTFREHQDELDPASGLRVLEARSRRGPWDSGVADSVDKLRGRLPFQPKSGWAVLFLSSVDETVGLGGEWSAARWASQFDAFQEAASWLRSLGFGLIARVHPNSLNKAWPECRRVHEFASQIADVVCDGYSAVSSYDLLEVAAVCITWQSSVAPEAVALGVASWTLGPNLAAGVVDQRPWPLTGNPDIDTLLYQPKSQGALQWLAFEQERSSGHSGVRSPVVTVEPFAILDRRVIRLRRVIYSFLWPWVATLRPWFMIRLLPSGFGKGASRSLFRLTLRTRVEKAKWL